MSAQTTWSASSTRPTTLDLVTELLHAARRRLSVFCGLESYSYPFLALGAAGTMSAVGNLLPARVAELSELVAQGDHDGALRIHRELFEVNQAVFFETNPVPLKLMLALLGIGNEEVRPPLAPRRAPRRAGASSRSSAASRRRPRTGSHERHRDRPDADRRPAPRRGVGCPQTLRATPQNTARGVEFTALAFESVR